MAWPTTPFGSRLRPLHRSYGSLAGDGHVETGDSHCISSHHAAGLSPRPDPGLTPAGLSGRWEEGEEGSGRWHKTPHTPTLPLLLVKMVKCLSYPLPQDLLCHRRRHDDTAPTAQHSTAHWHHHQARVRQPTSPKANLQQTTPCAQHREAPKRIHPAFAHSDVLHLLLRRYLPLVPSPLVLGTVWPAPCIHRLGKVNLLSGKAIHFSRMSHLSCSSSSSSSPPAVPTGLFSFSSHFPNLFPARALCGAPMVPLAMPPRMRYGPPYTSCWISARTLDRGLMLCTLPRKRTLQFDGMNQSRRAAAATAATAVVAASGRHRHLSGTPRRALPHWPYRAVPPLTWG